jgi:hypothetical protein
MLAEGGDGEEHADPRVRGIRSSWEIREIVAALVGLRRSADQTLRVTNEVVDAS